MLFQFDKIYISTESVYWDGGICWWCYELLCR